jgi:hypothetical protein
MIAQSDFPIRQRAIHTSVPVLRYDMCCVLKCEISALQIV